MENEKNPLPEKQEVKRIFPGLDESEIEEAEENLRGYVALALRIYERIRQDPAAYAQFQALTGGKVNPTVNEKSMLSHTEA